MATTFKLKRNDTADDLQLTLKDAAGSAVSYASATPIRFHMRKAGASSAKVDAAATIVDAANGVIKYVWIAADVNEAGDFIAEFEITFSGGKIQTFPNSKENRLIVRIREDLA